MKSSLILIAIDAILTLLLTEDKLERPFLQSLHPQKEVAMKLDSSQTESTSKDSANMEVTSAMVTRDSCEEDLVRNSNIAFFESGSIKGKHSIDASSISKLKAVIDCSKFCMFQPLTDSYTQPIAVFASKSPVKGDDLAKLAVKAITYMENCGAVIHGIVSDGAATNKKMAKLLGVNGQLDSVKCWFTHPCDNERKVFVFSDAPHLIKCIRNRLYNHGTLKMSKDSGYISWKYYVTLFELDTNHAGHARACPKLSKRHIELDNPAKMRVRLATQVLQSSLKLLDDWERVKINNEITSDEFLTQETAEGLRLSLHSTMDLCRYLIDNYQFHYLLTGKVNQDNLEDICADKFYDDTHPAAYALMPYSSMTKILFRSLH